MNSPEMSRYLNDVADLLDYPGNSTIEAIGATVEALGEAGGETATCIEAFRVGIDGQDIPALEETYTRTFDISPLCCLEAGWHLFGESYDRGGFLVEMRGKLREFGVEETTELPDHLAGLLRLQARLEGPEATEFANTRLKVAVQKMLDGFGDGASPYRSVIEATLHLLELAQPSSDATEVENAR